MVATACAPVRRALDRDTRVPLRAALGGAHDRKSSITASFFVESSRKTFSIEPPPPPPPAPFLTRMLTARVSWEESRLSLRFSTASRAARCIFEL